MVRADIDERVLNTLSTRVDRILLCLECVTDNRNYLAALRTADVLGVQRVFVIHPDIAADTQADSLQGPAHIEQGRKKSRIARASSAWLDLCHFSSSTAAIQALRAEGWTIWATDLSPGTVPLTDSSSLQLPERLAIVMGSECSGISGEMRAAADMCVYLPMYGFTESLNVGVAAGLVLQALIAMDPSIRGQLLGEGRAQQLTDKWRAAAARNRPDHWPGATVSQGLIRLRHQQQVGQLIGQADAHGQQQSQHEGQQVGPTCWQQVGQQQPQQSQQAGQQQRLCGVQQMQQLGRQQESHAQHQDVAADGGDRPQRSSQQSKQPPQQPPL